MFNSTILDVAIGMIFIYLLLSLMCSAANETIEVLVKKRAIDLERGIREMLDPNSASGTNDIVQAFYNHPLINGLFEGSYQASRIAGVQRYIRRTYLPSYIPARNFALAIMDLIVPGGGQVSGAAGATANPASPTNPPQNVVNVGGVELAAAAPQEPAVPDPAVGALRAALLGAAPNQNAPGAAAVPAALADAVPVPPQIPLQMRQALLPLIDAAGNDITKVRENIEAWFNTSMERVSGWYKRRAQVTLMILGLFIAITVNADTITIVKRLSTDKALRESLVAAADAYAKANAQASPSPASSSTPATVPQPTPTACTADPKSQDCSRALALQAACKEPESPKCKYATNQEELLALGLPIGWDYDNDPKRSFSGWSWDGANGGWSSQLYSHWLGWLLTALAISLGAPFWFDLLNKFIAIRSAVKPKETSP